MRILLVTLIAGAFLTGCFQKDIYSCAHNDEVLQDGNASKIVVVKSKKVMVVYDKKGEVISKHRVSLGKCPIGTKIKQGDCKTPEGCYRIINKRHDKQYYKELLISYPEKHDIERAKKLGVNPGGGILVHGQVPWNWDGKGNKATLAQNWTEGCVALTNTGMDILWVAVANGTPIEIKP